MFTERGVSGVSGVGCMRCCVCVYWVRRGTGGYVNAYMSGLQMCVCTYPRGEENGLARLRASVTSGSGHLTAATLTWIWPIRRANGEANPTA